MKKGNRQTTTTMRKHSGVTIGIDLGDKLSHYCKLDEAGKVIEEGNLHNVEASVRGHFAGEPPALVAIETGTRTHWWAELLRSFGHQVIVADAREFCSGKKHRKNDRNDAKRLARYARLDPEALHPVELRSREQQADLSQIRVRDALVRTRTLLVNVVRALAKEQGCRLPASVTARFGERSRKVLPAALATLLAPALDSIDDLSRKIEAQEEIIEQLAQQRYPETGYLRSVNGVGTLTALTYVLTLGSPGRFRHSRDVGPYLGLRPAQQQSGEKDPQLGISKQGNGYLRKLLVQCAHHVLGRFGKPSELRHWGLAIAHRGGKNARKRAVVAVARKLAVLLHRLWVTRSYYQPFFQQPASARPLPLPAHV
jgi:transposase